MNRITARLALFLAAIASSNSLSAQEVVLRVVTKPGPQEIPARILPVPDSVSPALQKLLENALVWPSRVPRTPEEWRSLKDVSPPEHIRQYAADLSKKFDVTVTSSVINGVPCYIATPNVIGVRNRQRRVLHLHSGGWIFGSGIQGSREATIIAGLTGIKVIEVDYRVLPEHAFPAAMDDAIAVWKELSSHWNAKNIAVSGYSAGGTMALGLIQRAKREGLPLPGAVLTDAAAPDLSKTGDSYFTNDGVDNQFSYSGFWEDIFKLYANGLDLKNPLISPVYGDFSGFPPTVLLTGTRDIFLSGNVRVHQKLLNAGVPTQLLVAEAESHGLNMQAAAAGAPEGLQAYAYATRFLDAHLGHQEARK